MSTLAEIVDEITDSIQDAAFTEDWIIKQLNKAMLLCARRVLLPELEYSGDLTTVTTGPSVVIPSDWNYHRGIYYAEVEDAPDIEVLGSLSLLLRHYPNAQTELQTGEIEYVVIHNGSVFYYPIPTEAKTLSVKFYRKPTVFSKGYTEITELPDELQELLLISFVKWRAYWRIEDGAENGAPNTKQYKSDFSEALNLLDQAFDQGQSYPNYDRTTGWI